MMWFQISRMLLHFLKKAKLFNYFTSSEKILILIFYKKQYKKTF